MPMDNRPTRDDLYFLSVGGRPNAFLMDDLMPMDDRPTRNDLSMLR